MKVYSLQNYGDWQQQGLSYSNILKRLAQLDLDPLGVLDKKLNLPMEHQARVDAIQTKVNDEEVNPKGYEWTLRQLELVLKKRRLTRLSFGRSSEVTAMIVYLEREARQFSSLGRPHLGSPAIPPTVTMPQRRTGGICEDFEDYYILWGAADSRNQSLERPSEAVVSDSVLDDDLIEQLTLLLTPAREKPARPGMHQGEPTISTI